MDDRDFPNLPAKLLHVFGFFSYIIGFDLLDFHKATQMKKSVSDVPDANPYSVLLLNICFKNTLEFPHQI